jgi:hypothetical protein
MNQRRHLRSKVGTFENKSWSLCLPESQSVSAKPESLDFQPTLAIKVVLFIRVMITSYILVEDLWGHAVHFAAAPRSHTHALILLRCCTVTWWKTPHPKAMPHSDTMLTTIGPSYTLCTDPECLWHSNLVENFRAKKHTSHRRLRADIAFKWLFFLCWPISTPSVTLSSKLHGT